MRVHISAKYQHLTPENFEKFRVTWPYPRLHLDKFLGVMSGLSLGTLVPNLKSVALIVFELLAFNAEKFRGSRDPSHALLENFLGFTSGLSLGTLVPNLKSVAVTVLELLAFNSHDRPLRTDRKTVRNTHIERTHYLRHSLRSLGGDN